MQHINALLARCVELGGSDLHLKTDTGKVYCRINGDLVDVDYPQFSDAEFRSELRLILSEAQIKRFDQQLELDFAYELKGVSRFRGNIYQQRSHAQAAFRVIPYEISTMDDLQLPTAAHEFVQRPRGLVLVTGPAGSGKSTTLAAMIDRINRNEHLHIVTVEDPIEFVHDDQVALINQRELEVDTLSFANALKFVLRQDPDVILVGEMRDLETIHLAITAAETGHLVFATLHTVDAVQTIDRIIDVFPIEQQQQVRMQLSVNLVGVISQTLVRRKDGRGRIAAYEVLRATSAVQNLIRENKSYQINSILQTGAKMNMQTLDQSLANLVERDLITLEDAKSKSKDAGEFLRLIELGKDHQSPDQEHGHLRQDAPPQIGGPKDVHLEADEDAPPPPQGPVRGQPNRPGYKRD